MKRQFFLAAAIVLSVLTTATSFANPYGYMCASKYVDAYDLNGCQPFGGRVSIESASDGQSKYITCDYRQRECTAQLTCNNGYWDFSNLDCGRQPRMCEDRVFTVHNLGGWEPLDRRFYTGRGRDRDVVMIPTRSSDGRYCNVVVECEGSNWRPDWNRSRCP